MTEGKRGGIGRGRRAIGRCVAVVCPLLVVLAFAGSCARVGVKPPPEAVRPAGFIRGVLAADNTLPVSLAGAEVRLEEWTVVAGEGGSYALPKPDPGKHHIIVEKRFPSGPIRRVLGVATVYVADNPIELKIRVRDATDVELFCKECHPPKRELKRRDQIARDAHPSGVVPAKARKGLGKYDENGRVTCESCHSVHRRTANPFFTLVSFRDGRMCVQCH